MNSKKKRIVAGAAMAAGLILALIPSSALGAGGFEISTGFSFSRSQYNNQDFSWNRRWGASLGYNLTETSEIEISFQDVVDRTRIVNYEDTTFHDRIYSANWLQNLVGKSYFVQPYVKGGIGQLNREATGSYANGAAPASRVDSLTAILGGGLRIYLTRSFAIRSEVSSYLTGARIKTWKDNVAYTLGVSLRF